MKCPNCDKDIEYFRKKATITFVSDYGKEDGEEMKEKRKDEFLCPNCDALCTTSFELAAIVLEQNHFAKKKKEEWKRVK